MLFSSKPKIHTHTFPFKISSIMFCIFSLFSPSLHHHPKNWKDSPFSASCCTHIFVQTINQNVYRWSSPLILPRQSLHLCVLIYFWSTFRTLRGLSPIDWWWGSKWRFIELVLSLFACEGATRLLLLLLWESLQVWRRNIVLHLSPSHWVWGMFDDLCLSVSCLSLPPTGS